MNWLRKLWRRWWHAKVVWRNAKHVCTIPAEYENPQLASVEGTVYVISSNMPPARVDMEKKCLVPVVLYPQ